MERQMRTGTAIQIVAYGRCDVEKMHALAELADKLSRADLDLTTTTVEVPGVKDAGLTAAIALVGLALSAISTTVSVLTYWASTKTQYKVTLETGAATFELSTLRKDEIRAVIQQLQADSGPSNVVVKVADG